MFFMTKGPFFMVFQLLAKILSVGDTIEVGGKSQCGDAILAKGFSKILWVSLHTSNPAVRLNREVG